MIDEDKNILEQLKFLSKGAQKLLESLASYSSNTLARSRVEDLLLFSSDEDQPITELIGFLKELIDMSLVKIVGTTSSDSSEPFDLTAKIVIDANLRKEMIEKIVKPKKKFLSLFRLRRELRKPEVDNWGFDEASLDAYELFFSSVLGGITIKELVKAIKDRKGEVSVANILGGTTVLEELDVDKGYAIRLGQKKDNIKPNINPIYGDVLSKKTWAKLPNNLDFIISMGKGAYFKIPEDPGIWLWLLNQCWNKLSPNGIMLLQAPMFLSEEIGLIQKKWAGVIGVSLSVKYHENDAEDHDAYFEILITKGEEAPENLTVQD
ncbi:hypothetical protein KA111_01720 [Candidatus Woesebacteria bacterium]|nr:hypothetical protein [Candidatus Woesebacteria bacterium]